MIFICVFFKKSVYALTCCIDQICIIIFFIVHMYMYSIYCYMYIMYKVKYSNKYIFTLTSKHNGVGTSLFLNVGQVCMGMSLPSSGLAIKSTVQIT